MNRNTRNGFTLIETVVVCAIISLLLALVVPAIQRVRASAQQIECKNKMRNIALALQLYYGDYKKLPTYRSSLFSRTPEGQLGWMALILPYVEGDNLYSVALKACAKSNNPLSNAHNAAMETVVQTYYCPVDNRLSVALTDQFGKKAAYTSYLGINGAFDQTTGKTLRGYFGCRRIEEIYDGLTNTISFGERPPPDNLQAGWWYPIYTASSTGNRGPNNYMVIGGFRYLFQDTDCELSSIALGYGNLSNPCDRFHFWSLHGNGSNFAFADGAVRFIPYSSDNIVKSLASVKGGEVVDIDY